VIERCRHAPFCNQTTRSELTAINLTHRGEAPSDRDHAAGGRVWLSTRIPMKALLVWPKFDSFSFWNFERVCALAGVKYMTPPLGLLTVAALLPSEWQLKLVDENVEPLSDDDFAWADVVLVGSKIVHRERALTIIRRARELGLKVIVGGPDPTLTPAPYVEAGANFLCLGEAEVSLPPLLADFASGAPGGTYHCDRPAELATTPVPRFDLIDHRNYLYVGIQYSRGCPYSCEFCNVVDLFQGPYRTKSLPQVLAEMEALYQLGYRGQLDFFDDNLVGHVKSVKPFLRGVADWLAAHDYPFQLSTSVTLNVARDPELLELLRAARFKYFLVGIETPDEHALRNAQKRQNVGLPVSRAADEIYRRAGATIHSGFLLGLDGEAKDIADQIIQCIDEASIPWVMAGVVYPLPGTQLAKRLDRERRLFPRARRAVVARDQVSAGLQFKPQRPAADVLRDLVRVMRHAFDPENYFARCASVASQLNTVPKLFYSWHLLWRNVKLVLRLSRVLLLSRSTRGPFVRALVRVLAKNPAGVEALVTLAVLYVHFSAMLPYCYDRIAEQQRSIAELGEAAWLEANLTPPPDDAVQKPPDAERLVPLRRPDTRHARGVDRLPP
jgi:radical SAM superfamily enzyme YgiQ (UPF0313 family)